MTVVISPAADAALKQMGDDVIADLGKFLVPMVISEIEALSPASIQVPEGVILSNLQPALQAGLLSVLAKVKL